MSFIITQQSILFVEADAAVLCIENPKVPSDGAANRALAQAGSKPLLSVLRRKRFLPVCGVPSLSLSLPYYRNKVPQKTVQF